MKRLSLFLLLSMAMALPISAMETQPTKAQVALTYAAKGARAIGSGLWNATAKTFGWTFGISQLAIGGAAVGAGALGVYSLFTTHNKAKDHGDLSDEDIRRTLVILAGTAIAVPIGCMLISKGMKNVWNA